LDQDSLAVRMMPQRRIHA